MRRVIYLLFLLKITANSLKANELAVSFYARDSFPNTEKTYKGYRLSLVNFRVENDSKKSVSIKCDAVNTGRLPLIFSEKTPYPIELIVEIDSTDWPTSLIGQENAINRAILTQKINLAPGKFRTDILLKLNKEEPVSIKKNEQVLTKTTENTPSPIVPKQAKPDEIEPRNATDFEEKEACPDLILDTVYLVKLTKKTATLAFVVKNIGIGTARLAGENLKKDNDNLALNVYFSGTKKLSRGAMLADGIFIGTDPSTNGLLLPTEKFYAEIKISLENKTRFTPNVIFELDPFQTIDECNKTNNTKSLLLSENH